MNIYLFYRKNWNCLQLRAGKLLLKVISSSFPEWGKLPPSCAKRTFVRLAQEAYEALYNE